MIGWFSGCTTPGGSVEIVDFGVDPEIIDAGSKVVIHWVVSGAETIRIDHGIGEVNAVGSRTIIVNDTTVYTITACKNNETVSRSVTVFVKSISFPEDIIIDQELFGKAKRDSFVITQLFIYEDYLDLMVQYGGGCEMHEFTLIAEEEFMESNPVQTNLVLSHDAHNDSCEALITKPMRFNLSLLKEKWQSEYLKDSGEITMIIEGYTDPITYRFGDDIFSFLNVGIDTDKEEYMVNETVELHLFVENTKEENVLLEFPDGQRADFQCKNQSDDMVYLWSFDRGFDSAIHPVTIPTGETMELFNWSWIPVSNSGEVLKKGEYTIQGWLPGFYYIDENLDYSSMPGPKVYSDLVRITIG